VSSRKCGAWRRGLAGGGPAARALSGGRLTRAQAREGRRREKGHDDVAREAPLAEGADREDLDEDQVDAEGEAAEREAGARDARELARKEGGREDTQVAGEAEDGDRIPTISA
jgi:hypothetical protein